MNPIVEVESRVTRVHVYRRLALVVRAAALTVEHAVGVQQLRLTGLPPLLRDDSLRLTLQPSSAARVLDLHLELALAGRDAPVRPERAEALLELHRQRVELEVSRERENDRLALLESLVPARFRPTDLPEALAFPERPAATHLLDLGASVRHQLQQSRARLRRLERQMRALDDRLAEAQDALERESTAWAECLGQATKAALVRLEPLAGEGPLELELLLSYLVPEARWLPEYELRVRDADDEAELVLKALVAQRSGENWPGVELSFSTADLRRSAELPELSSWRIGRAQPPRPSGWRPLPDTLDELFSAHDAGVRPTAAWVEAPAAPPLPEVQRLGRGPESGLQRVVSADAAVSRLVDRLTAGPGAPPSERRTTDEYPQVPAALMFGSAEPAELEEPTPASQPDYLAESFTAEASLAWSPDEDRAEYEEDVPTGEEELAAPAPEPSLAPPPPAAMAPPKMRKRKSMVADEAKTMLRSLGEMPGGGGKADTWDEPEQEVHLSVERDALDYHRLRLMGPDTPGARGQLKAHGAAQQLRELLRESLPGANSALDALADQTLLASLGGGLPRGAALPRFAVPLEQSAGHFAVNYPMDAPGEVRSDGKNHLLTLLRRRGAVRRVFRCVPLLDPNVYQVVLFDNPVGLPLLAGPVRVYRGGDFVVTSPLDTTPPGKTISVNLGVEPAITIARNVHFVESTQGLFGGDTSLKHTVKLELRSRLPRPAQVEVFERVPVSYDEDIEVKVLRTTPRAEPYNQKDRGLLIRGGWQFRLTLEPEQSATCLLEYSVTIPSKRMLVGGNRRD